MTNPEDFHSFVIAEALRRKGVSVSLWHGPDFPSRQVGSLWTSDDGSRGEAIGIELALGDKPPSSIWLRRPGEPIPPAEIEAVDRQFALLECESFLRGLYCYVGRDSFWVNPLASISRARLKTEQLLSARRSGFRIPETLFSNDPRRIRAFIRGRVGRVIYKAFYPAFWQREDGVAVLFSSPVAEEDLPEDAVLQATPGIFQEVVPKASELRVTAIGRRLFAAKLDSQAIPSARLDFRAAVDPVPVEPFDLPPKLAEACLRTMDDLGIVFGCFDIIVTPEDEYVFLEVNEMGAFLWIEEHQPAIHLVDAFCEFLIQGRTAFHWPDSKPVSFQDVSANALQEMTNVARQAHVQQRPRDQRDVVQGDVRQDGDALGPGVRRP